MALRLHTFTILRKCTVSTVLKPTTMVLRLQADTLCENCYRMFGTTDTKAKLPFKDTFMNRKLQYSERKMLRYPVDVMYEVVADVERYSEFVPWCKKSKVVTKTNSNQKARLEVGFGKITEKYNSTVTCVEPHLVKAVCTDGLLFNSLQCTWRFAPGKTRNSCIIDFQVSFEFRSLLYSQLANVVFNEIVKNMVSAFEKRAKAIQAAKRMEEEKVIEHVLP